MKSPPRPSCVGHIQQHVLCLCQSNSLWQMGADEWLQAQQKWILPLSPRRHISFFLRTTPPTRSCLARIGTGSRHSARTKADQWRSRDVAHGKCPVHSLARSAALRTCSRSGAVIFSMSRWSRAVDGSIRPGPLQSAILTTWPQSELRLMCQRVVSVSDIHTSFVLSYYFTSLTQKQYHCVANEPQSKKAFRENNNFPVISFSPICLYVTTLTSWRSKSAW